MNKNRKRVSLMIDIADDARLTELAQKMDRSKMSLEREAIKALIARYEEEFDYSE
jgi:predicted transcriptional regulator